ncbi:MAG TPA: geranylgeranylglyceryl/heptaprenylglyceryl phosphate synthase [Bacteroidia bacterium]|nr:geranylgeranylglyceryl/heptaprenylglyceryl phosphate synthase [Bacteroidia bacterium]
MNVYDQISDKKAEGIKQLAVLIDPDLSGNESVERICHLAAENGVDYIFVGGSLVTRGNLHQCLRQIKMSCSIPVVIFPGNAMQIDPLADAILFMSLISGRNPELLIGNQVISAPVIRESRLEPISTGYMLVDSGATTAAVYMSNTIPLPSNKPEIAACTALAGEMLGLKLIFMDAGSGAAKPVSEQIISAVRRTISVPLVVGGGINTPEKAISACRAGADLIVIGNAIEKDPAVLPLIAGAVKSVSV